MIKNWLPALLGAADRAIETIPRTCRISLNSGSSGTRPSICRASLTIVGWIIVTGVRVSTLDHEAWRNSMEVGSVVVTTSAEIQKVLNVFRRFVRKKADFDRTLCSLEDGDGLHPFFIREAELCRVSPCATRCNG